MSFTSESLLESLAKLIELAGRPNRLVVAFSGGIDSTALLHALAITRDEHGIDLAAVHVDHQLHADSAAWASHCETVADSLGVAFCGIKVKVYAKSAQGPEAAARQARYDALWPLVETDDWLLSAHHKDDQAETLLLNLMRGSGPAGLAGIREIRPFAAGWLVRPLLDVSRHDLEAYAAQNDLTWIDDPSNEDRAFDRNYLRHDVIPLLDARWPDAASRIRRSAELAGEASALLDQLADADLVTLGDRPDRLAVERLCELPVERVRNVLRYVVRELGLPLPPATTLQAVVTDLIPAREDAQPVVRWPGVEIRRYRGKLYILPADLEADAATEQQPFAGERMALQPGLGELTLETGAENGLADAVLARGLEVRYRCGGEEIQLSGQSHTKKLKKLLQEEGVVPWMRDRVPLLYSGDRLVAVADLWLAADAESSPGTAIRWANRPAIH